MSQTLSLRQLANNLCVKTHQVVWKKKRAAKKYGVENLVEYGRSGDFMPELGRAQAPLAVMGTAGTPPGLITGEKELRGVFSWERLGPR